MYTQFFQDQTTPILPEIDASLYTEQVEAKRDVSPSIDISLFLLSSMTITALQNPPQPNTDENDSTLLNGTLAIAIRLTMAITETASNINEQFMQRFWPSPQPLEALAFLEDDKNNDRTYENNAENILNTYSNMCEKYGSNVTDNLLKQHNMICPISRCITTRPVQTSNGYWYEKSCIETWMAGGKTKDPLNNRAITSLSKSTHQQDKILILLHSLSDTFTEKNQHRQRA